MNIKYRPEIDGLRALAVLPVIAFHAGRDYFPQGYLGVDIFFVISGFLITSIIMGDLARGNFSFAQFYERRVRRILPALFLVIFCSIPLACLTILSSGELDTFINSLIACLLFVANFFYWHILGDYFSPSADYQPFLHIWSLAVEEQFYLFFPFVLIFLVKWQRRGQIILLGILTLASLLANIIVEMSHPQTAFYMLPTRFWQLSLGALMAITGLNFVPWRNRTLNILSLAGGGAIIFAYAFSASGSVLTSGLPVVLGTAFILVFARKGTIIARILSFKPIVGVGLISYSLYLWHQPVFVFARLHFGVENLSGWHYFGLSCLCIALAILSWFFVEQPFRKKVKRGNKPWLFKMAALGGVLLIASGFSSSFVTKSYHADNPYFTEGELVRAPNSGLANDCFREMNKRCIFGNEPEALLLGDSFAMHTANVLKYSPSVTSFVQLTSPACPPVFDYAHYRLEKLDRMGIAKLCMLMQQQIKQQLAEHEKIQYVILSSLFAYMVDGRHEFLIGGESHYSSMELGAQKLREMLEFLISQGKKPILIVTPHNGTEITRCLEKAFHAKTNLSACDMSLQSVLDFAGNKNVLKLLQKMEDLAPIIYLQDFLCTDGFCKISINNYPLYRDAAHLSIKGSQYLGKEIDLFGIVKARADSFPYPEITEIAQ